METKITTDNCNELSRTIEPIEAGQKQQAQCWQIVFDYLLQNGMASVQGKSETGIEKTIRFLEQNLKKRKINL